MACGCKHKSKNKNKAKEFKKEELLFKDKIFTTRLNFLDEGESEKRNLISIRDGYQEYLGLELGIEPQDKVFKVYRTAETISAIKDKLIGLDLIEEHIDPVGKIEDDLKVGRILTSEIISNEGGEKDSTIAIKNEINLFKDKLQFDNEQLSLGYTAKTSKCPSGRYDFVQSEIIPHHLAIVEAGRCGDICEFKDENFKEREKMEIDEIIKAITDLLQNGSDEDKAKLKALFATDEEAEEDKVTDDGEEVEEKKEVTDEDGDEEKKEYADSKKIANRAIKNFIDSDTFNKIVNQKVNEKSEIVDKAKNFLDSNYNFRNKTALQIQRDALKAEKRGQSFLDNEVPLAFKLLEVSSYDNSRMIAVKDNVKNEDNEFIASMAKGY